MTIPHQLGLRTLAVPTLFLILALGGCGQPENPSPNPEAPKVSSNQPQDLHFRALLIDLHADTPQRLVDENVDLGGRLPDGHLDIPRMREGGVDAQFFSIWVDPYLYPGRRGLDRAMKQIELVKAQVARHADQLEPATSPDDIKRIVAQGKLAALMGLEGGHPIQGEIEQLRTFYDLGVRYMTLTWSNSNEIGGSSGDSGRDRGLSDFGREVVREMNRLGMLVDISHVSDRTFFDTLAVTQKPVIASHSSARVFSDHPRNMSDDMLQALAKNGGVVCINFYPQFLDERFRQASRQVDQELKPKIDEVKQRWADDPVRLALERSKLYLEARRRTPPVPLSRIADHIDHIVQVAGIDHVGLGSDFDGIDAVPEGLEDCSKFPALTEELKRRGYADDAIIKILGGNLLRVFESVVQTSDLKPQP
jgi:membrane dipeptidase